MINQYDGATHPEQSICPGQWWEWWPYEGDDGKRPINTGHIVLVAGLSGGVWLLLLLELSTHITCELKCENVTASELYENAKINL